MSAPLTLFLILGVKVSLAALVLAIGLDAKLQDVLHLLLQPKKLLRAFVAISVIVPAAAAVIVWLLRLPPWTGAGLVLMALSPVPPVVPGRMLKQGASRPYAYGLFVAFAAITIAAAPATVALLGLAFGAEVAISPQTVAYKITGSALLPLIAGMLLALAFPSRAQLASLWAARLGQVLLLAVIAILLVKAWPDMAELTGDGVILAIVAIVVIALAGGHLLGGEDRTERIALASAAAIRHPGLALLIANANFQDQRVTAAILLFLFVGIVVVTIYHRWMGRAEPAAGAQPAA